MKYESCIVIGAGAFGTSMASVVSNNFKKVIIKVRSQDLYEDLKKAQNTRYLPGITLAKNIVGALTWDEVEHLSQGKVELVILGLPSSAIKTFCEENYGPLNRYLKTGIPMVSLCKGIDPDTLELPDELLMHSFSDFRDSICFLSGPSFAKEILDEQITLVSLAGRSKRVLTSVSPMLQTNYFSIFHTYDVTGLLLGGALKNVLAIGGGIIEGLGHNHNTRAALITLGILDMLMFGTVFNARPETFYGLSGMGDLILTITGDLSRNKLFGLEIAKGKTPEEIFKEHDALVEGYKTTKAVQLLAEKYEIRCKIFNGVYRVLYEKCSPQEVIKDLMRLSSKVL